MRVSELELGCAMVVFSVDLVMGLFTCRCQLSVSGDMGFLSLYPGQLR